MQSDDVSLVQSEWMAEGIKGQKERRTATGRREEKKTRNELQRADAHD